MDTSQSKLSLQEVFDNKKLFSNKIHVRFLRVIEEISISLDKFEIANDEDKKLFLNAVNHHYNDLCAVIFHLRQVVITIDGDDQSFRNVIIELNKIAFSVQESLNLETEKLKIHLEGTLIHVGSQMGKLMKIIEFDIQQKYKQELVDIQLDLLISAGVLKLYIQHPNTSISEWERSLHEAVEKLRTNLNQIKNGHELLVENFSHYTRINLQNLQNIVDYMRKMRNTKNFSRGIAKAFENCETLGNHFISELLGSLLYDNPMKAMLDTIDDCHKSISKAIVELQEIVKPIMDKNIGKNDIEMAKQLVIHVIIGGLNGMCIFNQSIEDGVMKK